jgi:hypothetical protein
MRAAILPCLVEGLEFVQPDPALFELGDQLSTNAYDSGSR